MHRYLSIFLILLLLLVSCEDEAQRRKFSKSLLKIIEQLARNNQKKEPLQFKKGEEYLIKVVRIADGDSFTGLTEDKMEISCRIYGIDAPENQQPFSNRSKQTLIGLISNKQVRIKIRDIDQYRRAVVQVYTEDEKDISAEMLRAGMAWHYKQYSKEKEYAELEKEARQQKIGLWADKNPIEPWEWRRR